MKECLVYLAVFGCVLLVGLVHVGMQNRDVVDPTAYGSSNYVETRGFPVPWLVTAELPELDLGIHDRILFWAIAFNFLLYVLFVGIPWVIVAQILRVMRRQAERQLEKYMRERGE